MIYDNCPTYIDMLTVDLIEAQKLIRFDPEWALKELNNLRKKCNDVYKYGYYKEEDRYALIDMILDTILECRKEIVSI